jgi:tetratricopeptide (TPR) repeat protein
MNFTEEHIASFRAQLDGTLSAEEQVTFDQQISVDSEFKRAFEEFQQFEATLKDVEVLETYDQVGKWERGHQQTKKTPIRRLWIATASVAAAAAVVWLVLVPIAAESNDELVTSYFEPYDNVVTVRGKKEVLDKALLAYDKKEFKRALELLNQYPNDSIGIFYRAESLMALKRYEEAAKVYDDVIAQQGVFEEVATFHKALSLVGLDEMEKAKLALKQIPENSFYSDQAKDLLARL